MNRLRGPRRTASIVLVFILMACPTSRGSDENARQSAAEDARTRVARGDKHAVIGEIDEAIADYTAAIQLDPTHANAYARRAAAWMTKHESRKAIDDDSVAIALEPGNRLHFLARSLAWSRLGNHNPAIADLDHAIRLDPDRSESYVARATEWEKDNQWDRALSDYQTAIALDPRSAPAYAGRGRIWGKQGEYRRAVANFAEHARAAPDDPAGHRELAWLLATCDDDDIRDGPRARAEATTACALTKWTDSRCLETLAAADAALGDFEAAARWQARAIERFLAGKDRYDLRIRKRQDADMNLRLFRYKKGLPHRESPERPVR